MIIAVHRDEADPILLDQMHKLRAQCFLARRGWQVNVKDGRELDEFDDLNPLYLMAIDDLGELRGSLRLLQTTGPTMLGGVFSGILGDEPLVRSATVWESTRFCVDTSNSSSHAQNGVNHVTSELLEGLFTLADQAGLDFIVSVYDLYMERILRRAGCLFDRYGQIVKYDKGLKTVAGVFDVGPGVTRSIRQASETNQTLNIVGADRLQFAA